MEEKRNQDSGWTPAMDWTPKPEPEVSPSFSNEERGGERFNLWVKTAVARIYFPPDRERVRQELRDHYEDRLAEYRAAGLSLSEGSRKALEAMGDAEETGRLLQAVHKPWLGWLLRFARLLLIAAVVFAVFHYSSLYSSIKGEILLSQELSSYHSPEKLLERYPRGRGASTYAGAEWTIDEKSWRLGSSAAEERLGQFRVSVDSASIVYSKSTAAWESGYSIQENLTELNIILRFRSVPWYTPDYYTIADGLWIKDEAGRVYQSMTYFGNIWHLPMVSEGEEIGMLVNDGVFDVSLLGQGLRGTYYLLTVKTNTFPQYSMADSLTVHLETELGELSLPVRFGPWEHYHENLPPLENEAAAVAELLGKAPALETAAAASGEVWTASVPWAALEQGEVEDRATLRFVLALYGPTDRQPVNYNDLFRRLSLRDMEGTVYPRREYLDISNLEHAYDYLPMRYSSAYYDGAAFFLISVPDAKPADTYLLTYRADGDELELRIEPEGWDEP